MFVCSNRRNRFVLPVLRAPVIIIGYWYVRLQSCFSQQEVSRSTSHPHSDLVSKGMYSDEERERLEEEHVADAKEQGALRGSKDYAWRPHVLGGLG